jgi:hypothetical protein
MKYPAPIPLSLNLSSYQDQLKVKVAAGERIIWDPFRKKWLKLSPEELVRQLLVRCLIDTQGYPKNAVALEKALLVYGMPKRFDACFMDRHTHPWMLVECKAPEVPLDAKVLEQALQYGITLQVPYLLLSNGLNHYLFATTNALVALSAFPEYPDSNP